MPFKGVVTFLALSLGLLGIFACAAGAYAVWVVQLRLQQANDRVFAVIDKGLEAVQDRVGRTRERVRQSKITGNEVTRRLQDWATRKAEDRLVARLEIESRADALAGYLQTADVWLVTSEESVRDIQRVLELGLSIGAPVDPAFLDEVVETIASLRAPLQQAERTVSEVREFANPVAGESEQTRLARVVRAIARVVITIGEIDTRLDNFQTWLSDKRTTSELLKARTSSRIFWAAIAHYLILAWVAAGQATMCVVGWKRYSRSRAVSSSSSRG